MKFMHLLYIWRYHYLYASDFLASSRWLGVMFYWGVRWCISWLFFVLLAVPPLCILCLKFLRMDYRQAKASLICDQMLSRNKRSTRQITPSNRNEDLLTATYILLLRLFIASEWVQHVRCRTCRTKMEARDEARKAVSQYILKAVFLNVL